MGVGIQFGLQTVASMHKIHSLGWNQNRRSFLAVCIGHTGVKINVWDPNKWSPAAYPECVHRWKVLELLIWCDNLRRLLVLLKEPNDMSTFRYWLSDVSPLAVALLFLHGCSSTFFFMPPFHFPCQVLFWTFCLHNRPFFLLFPFLMVHSVPQHLGFPENLPRALRRLHCCSSACATREAGPALPGG